MLVQRCTLDQHRLIVPVSITKPIYEAGHFSRPISQNVYRALVDTGAQRTVVSASVIAELGLMRTGHMQFKGIHEPRTHTRYLATLGLWCRRIHEGPDTLSGDQAERTLYSIERPIEIVNMDDNGNFDVILGFDVMKDFSFAFDHRDKVFQISVSP